MIHVFENDERLITDPTFRYNCGSFSKIHFGLNEELKKRSLYSPLEKCKYIVFSTGLDVNFCDGLVQKRVLINAWELGELPQYLISARKALEGNNYIWGCMSSQVNYLYRRAGFNSSPIINVGTDPSFWQREKLNNYYPVSGQKFKLLSISAANFRSNIDQLIEVFKNLNKTKYSLTIKDTDEKNVKLKLICQELKGSGYDVEYICERWNDFQIKNLLEEHHLCVYIPNGSGGLISLECSANRLPCISLSCDPIGKHPISERVKCGQISISKLTKQLNEYGLPRSIPSDWINTEITTLYRADEKDLFDKIEQIKNNYLYYQGLAEHNRRLVENNWTWSHSCDQLLKALNYDKIS